MKMHGTAGVVLILVGAAALPLRAHHGIAGFSMAKPLTIEGTVSKFEWTNPHGYLYVDVKDGQSQVATWRVEFGSVGNMRVRGLSKSSFKPGDMVRVVGAPRLDGSKEMFFQEGSFASGEAFGRPNTDTR